MEHWCAKYAQNLGFSQKPACEKTTLNEDLILYSLFFMKSHDLFHGASMRVWMDGMSIVGLDLAGVETRPTGFCILENMNVKTCVVYEDGEITEKIQETKPRIVAIDAPLSLPAGRKSIDQRTDTHLRECDKELLRRRIKFFPVTLGPMRKLTSRGIRLREILESAHFNVIEVYPGGAQDILGIPRKQQGLDKLRSGLKKLQIKGIANTMSADELDAITCAYVGKLYLEGKTLTYGTDDQTIIMPSS